MRRGRDACRQLYERATEHRGRHGGGVGASSEWRRLAPHTSSPRGGTTVSHRPPSPTHPLPQTEDYLACVAARRDEVLLLVADSLYGSSLWRHVVDAFNVRGWGEIEESNHILPPENFSAGDYSLVNVFS